MNECAGCVSWTCLHTNFDKPKRIGMTGYCGVWKADKNESDTCDYFNSRAEQEHDYLDSVPAELEESE